MQDKSPPPEKFLDVISLLPAEMLLLVTSFLDVVSLMRTKSVTKRLHELCANDEAGWITLCQQLWSEKKCVPPEFFLNPCMNSYRRSLEDAKTRHHIRPNEILFIPETETGPIWSFRFKEAAGPEWTAWDPWWNGRAARKMVFLQDGSVRQYLLKGVDQEQDLMMRDPQIFATELPSGRGKLVDTPVSMTWRFCDRPLHLPVRERGSYIRLTVAGRDVPTYVVRRSPTGNWGFLAESCWGVYASFELPNRQPEDGRMADSRDERSAREYELLADDSKLQVNNQVQWREALLYNLGATSLPEGERASDEFHRLFGRTVQPRNGEGPTSTAAELNLDGGYETDP